MTSSPHGPQGSISPTTVAGDHETLAVAEERASISVERRETGGVRVRLLTDEVAQSEAVQLTDEQVELTRHPIGREIDAMPQITEDDGLTIIPVVEERAVVVTRLFLVEEIHIRRTRQTREVEVPVTLRRQRVELEPLDPATADPADRV